MLVTDGAATNRGWDLSHQADRGREPLAVWRRAMSTLQPTRDGVNQRGRTGAWALRRQVQVAPMPARSTEGRAGYGLML